MKQTLTILTMFFTILSFGQDAKNLGKSYVMKQNYLAQKCDAVGDNLTTTTDALERTFVVIIEAISSTGYVISVPEFSKSARKDELNNKFVGNPSVKAKAAVAEVKKKNGKIKSPAQDTKDAQQATKIYFLLPFTEFDKVCDKPISNNSFTVGIPTIPVKLRFGNGGKSDDARYFRFEGNLNLGLSGGWKHSFGENNKYAINTLVGFTVASVAVDSLTTRGTVNSNTSAASFSPHFGFVFDVQSFQFGLYTGIDFLYGEPNKYWVYRNQPWLGIGIGYSLFRTDSNKTTND
jgi:hypothetical protein